MGGSGSVVLALVCTCYVISGLLLMVVCIYSFLVIKVILGVNLVSYATQRRAGMESRAVADAVNDFGRDPIGEGKEEQVRYSFNITIGFPSSFNSWIHLYLQCRCTTRNLRPSLTMSETTRHGRWRWGRTNLGKQERRVGCRWKN